MTKALSLDGPFWRRMARWGARRGPGWFVRLAPPVIGVVVCAVAVRRRRAIVRNLRRVRGRRGPFRDAADAARTFSTYASCLTEVLAGPPDAERGDGTEVQVSVRGGAGVDAALALGCGLVLVTAHTAGWEVVGRLFNRHRRVDVMIVEAVEQDAAASAIQDEARRSLGLKVLHVGGDPLSALPLVRHLRGGGAVALQLDRVPPQVRSRAVTLFGEPGRIPEGPLRLAALTGAPIVAVFVARTGHRRYEVFASPPIKLDRSAGDDALNGAAQELAARLEAFVRVRPTQWFHFRSE
jgi:lauroyl/myristoyl acyltransferase